MAVNIGGFFCLPHRHRLMAEQSGEEEKRREEAKKLNHTKIVRKD
jgi:hypothetical protein